MLRRFPLEDLDDSIETHLLPECADIVETLAGEKRRFKGFHSFTTVEHGKARQIDALLSRRGRGRNACARTT